MTADYSQIEMRIMAHLSEDAALIEAFRSRHDFHAETAARVFGVDAAEVTPAQRAKIKAMNYGLAYGLSAFGLSNQLRIPTEEARALMDEYFAGFGGVRDYLRSVVDMARKDGYTATIMGRRRYLPDLTSDNRQRREMAERMALNAPIQGSAADIIKVAMLGVHRALRAEGLRSRMLLQVHDELVLEVAEGEREQVEALVRREMAAAAQLSVRAGRVGGLRPQLGRRRALIRRQDDRVDRTRLQLLTRARVASLGPAGQAWLAELPGLLAELEQRWSIRIGRSLPGGSASYVARAETADGAARVVKVATPDPELADESRVLAAAGGRGYAVLHDHDPQRRALLLEALGPSLAAARLTPEEKLALLADTLSAAWELDLDPANPVTRPRAPARFTAPRRPPTVKRPAARRAGSIDARQPSPPTARAASDGQIVAEGARASSRSRTACSSLRSVSVTPCRRHAAEQ